LNTDGDLCKLKRAEQALRESKTGLRQLANAAFEGIVIHRQSHILEVNQAFCQLFGYSPAELQDKSLPDFLVPEMRETVWRKLIADEASSHEVSILDV
jgi:PAS domain S-box-containing protein